MMRTMILFHEVIFSSVCTISGAARTHDKAVTGIFQAYNVEAWDSTHIREATS